MDERTIQRFWAKVEVGDPDECWEWTASIGGPGYGQISVNRKPVTAHRMSFFIAHGYWPSMCCHRCANKKCVNPDHLYDGDARSNAIDTVKDGGNWQTNKTHCPAGHPYEGDNLYVNKSGHRWCRACHRESCRLYREKQKQ